MANHHKFRWGKWLSILALFGAGAGGGVWYFKSSHDTATQYQAAPAPRGDLTQAVTATGQVGPVINVQVGSQISGIVRKLNVDFNSVVKSNHNITEIHRS